MRSTRPFPIAKERALAIVAEVLKTQPPLSKKQKQVLKAISSEFPERFFDATTLSHWFGNVAMLIVRILAKDDKSVLSLVNLIYNEIRYNMQKDIFEKIRSLLEKEEPEHIDPAWINKIGKELPVRLFYIRYLTIDGKVDWDFILSKISSGITFFHREQPERRLKKFIEWTVKTLEEEKPSYFDPTWLDKRSPKNSNFIRYHYSWDDFRNKLPKEWQEKFVYVPKKIYTLKNISDKLVALLEAHQPRIFRPEWIRKKDFNMWLVLRNRLLGKKGDNKYPDWGIIVRVLPDHWQKRWRYRGVIEGVKIPNFTHNDLAVVQAIHEKYKKALPLFYFPTGDFLTRKEEDSLEDIILELRVLAEKGNVCAHETIISHLLSLCDIWTRRKTRLTIWDHHPAKLEDLIKKCIYKYKQSEKKKFIYYLNKSMTMKSRSLKERRFVSFDDRRKDYGKIRED